MTSYLVATKPDAAVHEKPELTSSVLTRLDYQIVAAIGEGSKWQKVEYRPGEVGYVLSADLNRPTGYSIDLHLSKGRWRINAIINYCD